LILFRAPYEKAAASFAHGFDDSNSKNREDLPHTSSPITTIIAA